MRYMRLYDFLCSCSGTEKTITSLIYILYIKDIRLTETLIIATMCFYMMYNHEHFEYMFLQVYNKNTLDSFYKTKTFE